MSVKLHFLHLHSKEFSENCSDTSEEQGERFHQNAKDMERRYEGFWDENMLADYCWSLCRDTSTPHKRKALKRSLHETCKPRKKLTIN